MAGEDFIILPNGEKLYVNGKFGTVNLNKIKNQEINKNSYKWGLFDNKSNENNSLRPKEIVSIFSSIKQYANKDGNNELSNSELKLFIEEKMQDYERISPQKMLNFLLTIQDEAIKSYNNTPSPVIENTIEAHFPELNFLELGNDQNVDISKMSFDYIKNKFYNDSEKYEIIEDNSIAVYKNLYIVDKNTGQKLLQTTLRNDGTNDVSFFPNNETEIIIMSDPKNNYAAIGSNGVKTLSVRNGKIDTLEIYDRAEMKCIERSYYENGIKYLSINQDKREYYNNGNIYRITDESGKLLSSPEVEELNKLLNSNNLEDTIKISEILQFASNENRIPQIMDDFFTIYGKEFHESIRHSNLSEDIKQNILNEICSPFVESKNYNATLIIESSKIKTEKYEGNEYKIAYDGPIVTIYNKDSQEYTRVNLKKLFQDYTDAKPRSLNADLKAIQKFPAEIIELMGKEVVKFKHRDVRTLEREGAAAYFTPSDENLTVSDFYEKHIVIHELAHAIDYLLKGDKFSSKSNFKARYDKYMEEWEASGHKRYNYEKVGSFSNMAKQFFKITDYSTSDEVEAFAICLAGILGYPDNHFKFIQKHFPDLIDIAIEDYKIIKAIPLEQRREHYN